MVNAHPVFGVDKMLRGIAYQIPCNVSSNPSDSRVFPTGHEHLGVPTTILRTAEISNMH